MYPTNNANISIFGILKIIINKTPVNNNFPTSPMQKELSTFFADRPADLLTTRAKNRLGINAAILPNTLDIPKL